MLCKKGGHFHSHVAWRGVRGPIGGGSQVCSAPEESVEVGQKPMSGSGDNKDRAGSHHDHSERLPDVPGPENHLTHLLKIDL